jgi:thiamine biosynthesis lipoprotein
VLNETGNAFCSDELIELVTLGQEYGKETDGAFNIALYPIDDAWGFFNYEYRVPDEDELKSLLELANPEDAEVAEKQSREWANGRKNSKLKKGIVYNTEGMKLDLGGIGKGYIADKIYELFSTEYAETVTGAVISLGGNILCYGNKPGGKSFNVGLQDPTKDVGQYVAVVTADAVSQGKPVPGSIVTSGNYERAFELDGKKYTHIIDPETGYPVDNGLVSVTVVCENSTLADMLTTALFVMGYDKAVEFYKSGKYDFEMALIDDNNKLYITEGLSNVFKKNTIPMEVIQ